MNDHFCKNFIYSSSATVYGDSISPVTETSLVGNGLSCNYAKNKYFMEKYLIENKDKKFSDWNIIILRYFNPIGAHPSGLIGEDPKNIPNNIFPYLMRVAKYINSNETNDNNSYKIFTIFGRNYNTDDGTCIRDYVHVQDLAKAHVNVLKLLEGTNGENVLGLLKIYNVGTGIGTSVLELIEELNKVLVNKNKKPIPYKIGDRRSGDIDISYANVDKIYKDIEFKTEFDIATMCKDGLNFVGLW